MSIKTCNGGLENLKEDFPVLTVLNDEELMKAISSGGLLKALTFARAKKATLPRRPGRPENSQVTRKTIQRRGQKSNKSLIPDKSNIQIAELAHAYMVCLKCRAVTAAEETLKALKGYYSPGERRQLAKLISEIRPRAQDKKMSEESKRLENIRSTALATGIIRLDQNRMK